MTGMSNGMSNGLSIRKIVFSSKFQFMDDDSNVQAQHDDDRTVLVPKVPNSEHMDYWPVPDRQHENEVPVLVVLVPELVQPERCAKKVPMQQDMKRQPDNVMVLPVQVAI